MLMIRSRILTLAVAILIGVISLTGCAKPEPEPSKPVNTTPSPPAQTISNPPTQAAAGDGTPVTPGEVDVAVRTVMQGYLDALNRKDYAAATAYWSPSANVKPDDLKTPGVTDWFFISSEMIDSTAATAHVQVNFTVKVAPGAQTGYTDGRNVRFFRLALETNGWKIQSVTTSP